MTTACSSAAASFSITYAYGGSPFSGSLTLYDFNSNLGIASNSSSLDITLLEGGCNNFSNIPTTLPSVGRIINFACNDFVFSGIVNNVTYTVSENGFLYKVKLLDANKIIENVTVLIKDYYCPLAAPNFINAAYLLEGAAAICPPGEDTQNWPRNGNCAVFGTSGSDGFSSNNGISLFKLCSVLNGQTIYTTVGEGISIDLSQLLPKLSTLTYATVNASDMSLMSIIQTACDYAACDFFIALNSTVATVYLIDRSTEPTLGIIGSIIADAEYSGTLIRSENGFQELYADSNKVILGDKVSYLAEREYLNPPDMMLGYDTNGQVVRASGPNFRVKINTQQLRQVITNNQGVPFPHEMFEISEEEIIIAGSYNMWMAWGLQPANANSLSRALLDFLEIANQQMLKQALDMWTALTIANNMQEWKQQLLALSNLVGQAAFSEASIKYQTAFDWFKSFIDEYYGKKWLVPLNGVCAYPRSNVKIIRGDTGEFALSDSPADSGFPSFTQSQQIRGLKTWVETFLFETSDNRISGFVDSNVDQVIQRTINTQPQDFKFNTAGINPSSCLVKNKTLYLKMSVGDGEFHINPRTNNGELLIHLDSTIPMIVNINNGNLLNNGMTALAGLFKRNIFDEMTKDGKGFSDNSTINLLRINPVAGVFQGIVIPLRSNIYVYGPWTATKGPIGSTKVDIVSDLNPWNFGGFGNMNMVGQSLAQMGLRGSNIEETGSFTLAEPPGYSIQYFLNAGILLDSINVTYGANGVTTDYSFKTAVSKFGQYGQALADRVKQITQIRSKVVEQIKNERRKTLTLAANLNSNIAKSKLKFVVNPNNNNAQAPINAPSPGFVLVGGYLDANLGEGSIYDSPQSPETYNPNRQEICSYSPSSVSEATNGFSGYTKKVYETCLSHKYFIEASYHEEKYKATAVMSLDAIISPVSTEGRKHNGTNKLPRYCQSWNKITCLSKSRPSMPPLILSSNSSQSNCLSINQKYLNPILSTVILNDWDDRKSNTTEAKNIFYLSFGDSIKDITFSDVRQTKTDFGFFALRGPLVLQSWGYDTQNKPIPNITDNVSSAEDGIFNDKTKNAFMSNWLDNPASWPVGPIDLRFDRDRGVWVSPPQERIVVAKLTEDLSAMGSANAVLINPSSGGATFYDDYKIIGPKGEDIGSNLNSAKIIVYDFLNQELYIDTIVYAYYNDNKYIIINYDDQPKSKYFKLKSSLENCCNTTGDEVRMSSTPTCAFTSGSPENSTPAIDASFYEPCNGLKNQSLYDIGFAVRLYNASMRKDFNTPIPANTIVEAVRERKYPSQDSTTTPPFFWKITDIISCSGAKSGTKCDPYIEDNNSSDPWYIDGVDLKQIPNYDRQTKQGLIHEFGCLSWINLTECTTTPPPTTTPPTTTTPTPTTTPPP
jgi:hypothetical protein